MREMDMNNLSDEDKAWLRSWNRGHEIPDEQDEQPGPPTPVTDPPKDPAAPDPQVPPVAGSTTSESTDAGDGGTDEDPFNGESAPDDYNDWSVPQLQYELKQRKLPKSGNKPELVARLLEDDEANPE